MNEPLVLFRFCGTIVGFIAFGMASTNTATYLRRRRGSEKLLRQVLTIAAYRCALFAVIAFTGSVFRVAGVLTAQGFSWRDVIAPIIAVGIIVGETRLTSLEDLFSERINRP